MNFGCFYLLLLAFSSAYAQQAAPDSGKQRLSAQPIVITLTRAPGQPRATSAFLLGLKVGGALTAKAGENVRSVPKTTFLPGGVAGIYASIPLRWVGLRSPVTFALQPELLGSMQGSRYNKPSDDYNVTFRLYYVCLPVLLTANFHGFFLGAGLQGSYLVGVRERYEFVLNSVPSINTSNRTTGYQRQELAFVGARATAAKWGSV